MTSMKPVKWLALALPLVLSACQPISAPITIRDGENIIHVQSDERSPLLILTNAGSVPSANDRVFVNGIPHALDEDITAKGAIQLQLRRAVTLTLVTPQERRDIQTSARTVAEALHEAGFELSIYDNVHPPLDSPLTAATTVTFIPAQELSVTIGGQALHIRSAAETVGAALAEAGIPLTGLDTSRPVENEALPADGKIQVTRVTESISVELETIPFKIETRTSPDIPFGQDEILQPGVEGVTMIRTRIRYENGAEVSREVEDESVLSAAQTQIVAKGSQIVLSPVGGNIPYQYWYATEMYASWYSPCNSGTGGCSYGTASGARAGYGIVAVDYSIYSYLAGMRVYIPGYGLATIGDTGGGPIIETSLGVPRTQWIDLGYDDNNIGALSGWVTVYFLEPAPAEIPYFFK
ncbi:MAG: G5 domain-containing protein [Anaerolineales bacterium]|nr:G5 domain-containing protein [Anaerolineales bacterium]